MNNPWQDIIRYPLGQRLEKPREKGLTMVIDKGLGLKELHDLLEMTGNYVDFLKLGFGTSALYNEKLLKSKIALCCQHNVKAYPGGTLMEIAYLQGRYEAYLSRLQSMGFDTVEISDGTVPLRKSSRLDCIKLAASLGLTVLTEVGKKDPAENPGVEELIELCQEDLASGAWKVIMEARESGIGIGIFDKNGAVLEEKLAEMTQSLKDNISQIIWEAPLKNQQVEMILRFGTEVNLGNIQPNEVLSLEALRTGLRGDTLRIAVPDAISSLSPEH